MEIIENIKIMIDNLKKGKNLQENLIELRPWYRGYTGTIENLSKNKYISRGRYNVINESTVEIKELPIKVWTDKYKEFLESVIIDNSKEKKGKKKEFIRNYNTQCTDSKVSFKLTFHPDDLDYLTEDLQQNDEGQNRFEKTFKLTGKINTTNMVLYNENGHLKKYDSVNDILENYFNVRLDYYLKRKEYQLKSLKNELVVLNSRVRFILEFISGDIVISNRTKQNLLEQLKTRDYPLVDENYDYLIKMPIYNLTKERIEELNNEKDLKTQMFTKLEDTETYNIWLEELKQLQKKYNEFNKKKEKAIEENEPKKKILKKKKK